MERKHIFLPTLLIKKLTADAKKNGISFGEMLRRVISAYYDSDKKS